MTRLAAAQRNVNGEARPALGDSVPGLESPRRFGVRRVPLAGTGSLLAPRDSAVRGSVAIVLVLGWLSPLVSAAAVAKTVSASAGKTHATLTYFPYPDDYGRPRPRLEITRSTRTFSITIPANPQDRVARGRVVPADSQVAPPGVSPLVVRDLDRDGEPEVHVMLFWGGSRCCFWSRVYRFDERQRRFRASNHFWGNGQDTPLLRDLNGDSSVEFVARDGRFESIAHTYGYTDPVRIWSWRHGTFVDVTRRLRGAIRRDARGLWRRYTNVGRGVGARLLLAAWVGDEYLLRRSAAADAEVRHALTTGRLDVPAGEHLPTSRNWVGALNSFLERTGYR